MFERIVWATDGSPGADTALEFAKGLAGPGGRIVAVHCTEMLTGRAMGLPANPDEPSVLGVIRDKVDALVDEGFDASVIARRSHEPPADTIAAIAAEENADLIVCGTRGHGTVSGVLLGSVSQRLPHVAHIPVLIVPPVGVPAAPEPEQEKAHA